MRNMKIGVRLAAGFFVILLMLVAGAAGSYFNVGRLNGAVLELTQEKWASSEMVNDLKDGMDEISLSAASMMLTTDAVARNREAVRIATLLEKIDTNIEKFSKTARSEKEKKLLGAVKASRDIYRERLNTFLGLSRTGREKEALALFFGPLTAAKKTAEFDVDEMHLYLDLEVKRVGAECAKIAAMTNTVTLLMGLGALIIGIILSIRISRSITKPLQDCVEAARKISEGDTSVMLDISARDEIGVLQQSMAKMADAIRLLIVDTKVLSAAAVAGKLATRSDAAKHQGEFRNIVQGFNDTLDAVITPINEVRGILEAMAQGDLSRRMTGEVRGEFAVLKESLNNSLTTFSAAIGNIISNARQVAAASSQTSGAVSQISDGSQNQFHAIVQVATAIRQTAASITDITRSTEEASLRAKDSVLFVSEGRVRMGQMVDVVKNIAINSEKINKLTEFIEKIASKTNLLSLNAAIEAARAGEHGRGFAVVAEEVGKLAASVAESTQEIVLLVSRAAKDASQAVLVVNEISGGMGKISDDALRTESMLQRISVALEEQSAAVQEINTNITSLNRVAESNAAASEEITATVVELALLADNTRREAERFRG